MTTLSTNTATSQGSASFFATVFAAFTAWNDERATRKALNSLTTRELDDIGLTRGDIAAVASKTR